MPDAPPAGHRIRFGSRTIWLPRSKFKRILLGSGLVLGGLLSFLPILGLWMLPLGIMVLSVDIHLLRCARRRFDSWWGRRRRKRAQKTAENQEKRAG